MERIREGTVLFDGGMGSLLIAAGLGEKEIPEQWNFLYPDRVIEMHTAYIEAGADVIQTNTFGASGIKLASSEAGSGLDPAAVNRTAAELVREALKRAGAEERFVAGDIGPTGQFFAPMGTLSAEKARESFRRQAEALEEGGVDLFLIETMYDIREAVEAVRAVRDVSGKPVVAELTFDRKTKGYFTLVGDTAARAVEVLPPAGADVIGANCTMSSEGFIGLAEEFRKLTGMPVIMQPNAGKPHVEGGMPVYRQKPEEFADDMEKIIGFGIEAVGGCCGTTPGFIRVLRERIDRRGKA